MKTLQDKVQRFCDQHGMDAPLPYRVLDLVSEVGELAKEVLTMHAYGQTPTEYKETFEEELGDVVYSLITVANTHGVDLEKALNQALDKYGRRIKAKGSAGSGGDA